MKMNQKREGKNIITMLQELMLFQKMFPPIDNINYN